jgi:hypothetical protein
VGLGFSPRGSRASSSRVEVALCVMVQDIPSSPETGDTTRSSGASGEVVVGADGSLPGPPAAPNPGPPTAPNPGVGASPKKRLGRMTKRASERERERGGEGDVGRREITAVGRRMCPTDMCCPVAIVGLLGVSYVEVSCRKGRSHEVK